MFEKKPLGYFKIAEGMESVKSSDSFARIRDETQSLGITAQAKLSEYLQINAKEKLEDKLIAQKFDHEMSIAQMQLRARELEHAQRHEV